MLRVCDDDVANLCSLAKLETVEFIYHVGSIGSPGPHTQTFLRLRGGQLTSIALICNTMSKNCTFGDRCRFKHEDGNGGGGGFGGGGGGYSGGYGGGRGGGGGGVCFNFQKGSCTYGDNCRFKH